MLDEQSHLPGSYGDSLPFQIEQQPRNREQEKLDNLREAADRVMQVEQVSTPTQSELPTGQVLVQFAGYLTVPAAEAQETLEPVFKKYGVHAYFTEDEQSDKQLITVLRGRFNPGQRPVWINAALVVVTFFSLLFTAAGSARLWEGLPYALSIMLILGAHELGHYFAARRHRVSVTLPYFIPMPLTLFGTLGAFIQLREPMKNRQVLFDVGVSGPLAGLIFAIPILLIGLATSEVTPTPDTTYIQEGNSVLYAAAKYVTFGEWLPADGEDVSINQLAWAGWTGLFITGLNLIPLGQLDGGHITYSIFGRQIGILYIPVIGFFIFLVVQVNVAWLVLTILMFLLGRAHATPLDDITPLDLRRRMLGFIVIVLFFLMFVPDPIKIING